MPILKHAAHDLLSGVYYSIKNRPQIAAQNYFLFFLYLLHFMSAVCPWNSLY